jgi:Mg/Co/Ni transporter MgtE
MAITIALFSIVFFSIIFGATLPLLLKSLGIDPAHSSTSIQVIMDILGVVFTVGISTLLLDSPWGHWIVERLVS